MPNLGRSPDLLKARPRQDEPRPATERLGGGLRDGAPGRVRAGVGKTLLSAPHRRLDGPGLAPDRVGARVRGGEQRDPAVPELLLPVVAIRDKGLRRSRAGHRTRKNPRRDRRACAPSIGTITFCKLLILEKLQGDKILTYTYIYSCKPIIKLAEL